MGFNKGKFLFNFLVVHVKIIISLTLIQSQIMKVYNEQIKYFQFIFSFIKNFTFLTQCQKFGIIIISWKVKMEINRSETWDIQKSLTKKENRIPFKCKEERNNIISREIGSYIKKQLKTFFAQKKIQKEVENHNKDFIVVETPSPMQRVHEFRQKEKENSMRKLQRHKELNEKIDLRVSRRIQEKRKQNLFKSHENVHKILKVRQNYENIQEKKYEKIQQLKEMLSNQNSRRTSRLNPNQCEKDYNRVATAEKISRVRQNITVNNFMKKMKDMEERALTKELKLEEKKALAMKNATKCLIQKRNDMEESTMEKWSQQLDRKFQKFQKAQDSLINEKSQLFQEKSLQKSTIFEKVWERKTLNEQVEAQKRFESVRKKLQKIKNIENHRNEMLTRSHILLNRNQQNDLSNNEKQQHNDKMRKIYNVIKRIKSLDNSHRLSDNQIQILLSDLSPHDPEYKEIMEFLTMTKDKYFEKKQKDEEEKGKKKNKKGNGKNQ